MKLTFLPLFKSDEDDDFDSALFCLQDGDCDSALIEIKYESNHVLNKVANTNKKIFLDATGDYTSSRFRPGRDILLASKSAPMIVDSKGYRIPAARWNFFADIQTPNDAQIVSDVLIPSDQDKPASSITLPNQMLQKMLLGHAGDADDRPSITNFLKLIDGTRNSEIKRSCKVLTHINDGHEFSVSDFLSTETDASIYIFDDNEAELFLQPVSQMVLTLLMNKMPTQTDRI